MNFNWITGAETDEHLQRFCVELEYQLRPKITKFLISRFEFESFSDFSCFYFDVDLLSRRVRVSDKTPKYFFQLIQRDFDREIGLNCC